MRCIVYRSILTDLLFRLFLKSQLIAILCLQVVHDLIHALALLCGIDYCVKKLSLVEETLYENSSYFTLI